MLWWCEREELVVRGSRCLQGNNCACLLPVPLGDAQRVKSRLHVSGANNSNSRHATSNSLYSSALSLSQPLLLPFSSSPTPTVTSSTPTPTSATKFRVSHPLLTLITTTRRRRSSISPTNSASINGFSLHENIDNSEDVKFRDKLTKWIAFLQSIAPGGSWWMFVHEQVHVTLIANPVTLVSALGRMWTLVAKDKWIIFTAFSALILILASLSEISIPHFLASFHIFCTKWRGTGIPQQHPPIGYLMFHFRNMQWSTRVLFWHSKYDPGEAYEGNAIRSSSSRIYHFLTQTVGDLTSRLGSDCQQVARVIGNDLNMILRHVLQGTGSLIYLLILSCPLALSTLATCFALSTVMLIYGQYQKKAATLTQEFTASSNEVAQETLSLMRTVRVYGT